ncbi:MAG: hypothetical protein ACJ76J_12170 [Thermoanaerobaculia bacterium]
MLALLGLPACVALVAGLGIAVREGGEAWLFVVSLFAVLAGFFVFLYSWEAERFLVYPVWMAGLLIAGLSPGCRGRCCRRRLYS